MAAAQQQQSTDSGMGPIWILVLLFLVGFVVWKTGHQHIVRLVFFLDLIQAQVVHFFLGDPHLTKEIFQLQSLNPVSVNWEQMVVLTNAVGEYTRYPFIVILVILAGLLYRSDITLKYRRAHSMKSLVMQEQHNWPAIMPVVKEDLVAMDVNSGPWAMAMTPLEFATKYDLLKKDDVLLDKSQPGQEMTAGIRRGDAKRVFTLQLGPYWDGFERCPPYARALAAVFLCRMNRDRGSASKILEAMDKAAVSGKMDYNLVDAAIRKHQQVELVQEVVTKHAYMLTVMASLIQAARLDGVVPSSEFLWLKTVDRRLWYMLNCVGRQTPFAEVAGPFAHWKAENAMKRRSLVPMIDEAIKALEIAVKEVKLTPKQMQELKP